MDGELYDEFGNYIGPDLESDESEEEEDAQEGVEGVIQLENFIYKMADSVHVTHVCHDA